MADLVLTTFDWVPPGARGYVRDLRIRWALEEARLPYRIQTTPSRDKGPAHFAHQPFGQVPWLTDGDISIFESGAVLLYLAERSETLMPSDPRRRAAVQEWLFAALNSVEMATQPLLQFEFSGETAETPARKRFDDFFKGRLTHMEAVLGMRAKTNAWLAGGFSIADIVMADVLRTAESFPGLKDYPAARAYVARATARPAFKKAYADQMAHFARSD